MNDYGLQPYRGRNSRLTQFKDSMPPDWDGVDIFARYSAAVPPIKLQVHDKSYIYIYIYIIKEHSRVHRGNI